MLVTGPPAATTVSGAVNALRARGLRISGPRRVVLEALFAAGRPVSAADIATGLGGTLPPADLASVYRNLDVLERAGLARRVPARRQPRRYAPAGSQQGLGIHAACAAAHPDGTTPPS
jgi:Fe2+ or Zn2+ uptake regulation protein